jgi:hypothetical protein
VPTGVPDEEVLMLVDILPTSYEVGVRQRCITVNLPHLAAAAWPSFATASRRRRVIERTTGGRSDV